MEVALIMERECMSAKGGKPMFWAELGLGWIYL